MINKSNRLKTPIGIIGGTGIYDSKIFEIIDEIKITTPYGEPSDTITICKLGDKKISFLPRHGKGHRIPPHKINFRANVWALKNLGVKTIIAPSAVGSLKDVYKPGDIVLPDQFIDLTKNRKYTFYDGGEVCHISSAEPFCPELRETISSGIKKLGFVLHVQGTYVCIEGPRFSTKAESSFYKNVLNADIIGMTLIPECILAREMEMCYVSIATVTDYDVWADVPVSSKDIIKTLNNNIEKIKQILLMNIPNISDRRDSCNCSNALKDALV